VPRLQLALEADHPAFIGHFPGTPIVPGVLLLDQVQRAVESATGLVLTDLVVAKFLSPARPGDALEISYEVDARTVRFQIRCARRAIAHGRFLTTTGCAA
jgi:3-hydroxyacyl-[acyl-carrier-protein] dehydratase